MGQLTSQQTIRYFGQRCQWCLGLTRKVARLLPKLGSLGGAVGVTDTGGRVRLVGLLGGSWSSGGWWQMRQPLKGLRVKPGQGGS